MFRPKADQPKFKFRRTPPPDYQSRSTKMKIFGLLALLMGVLWAAERARDPQSWDWFWRLEQRPEQVRNRLDPKPSRTAHDAPGTIVQTSAESPAAADGETEGEEEDKNVDPTELAWRQGWKENYSLLDPTERTLLFEILAQGRGEHKLGPTSLEAANKLVLKLNDNWNSYGMAAYQSLAELKPDERESWEKILREVNERWSQKTRPALEAAAHGVQVPPEQLPGLEYFQQTLDQLALNLVKDDSPLRPDEGDMWFRLMNRAAHTPEEELSKASLHGITYLQMFKQSSHYRGDPIHIRGIVRGAWKTPAVNNPWGLQDYYVLWIHPDGGPNSPIVVHVRSLPAGFPEVKERGDDGKWQKLHEDVTVDGYFFKRQAYLGLDGTYAAPLLLAKSVNWQPRVAALDRNPGWEWNVSNILWVVAATLSITLVAVGMIYWRMREQERYSVNDEAVARADMSALKDVELTPTVEEGLRNLEKTYQPPRPRT
jgi:hypothetical protein